MGLKNDFARNKENSMPLCRKNLSSGQARKTREIKSSFVLPLCALCGLQAVVVARAAPCTEVARIVPLGATVESLSWATLANLQEPGRITARKDHCAEEPLHGRTTARKDHRVDKPVSGPSGLRKLKTRKPEITSGLSMTMVHGQLSG